MGHNVTEGAIVQHLSKLRTRRLAAKKDVPPPLRRGGIGASVKTPVSTASKGEPVKHKGVNNPVHIEDEIMDLCPDHSSDEDYDNKKTSQKNKKSTKMKKSNAQSTDDVVIKHESYTGSDEIGSNAEAYDDDELLVPGAKFLEYPNDRQTSLAHQSPTSPSPSPKPKPSKIVVLKYKKTADCYSHYLAPEYQQAELVKTEPFNLHGHGDYPISYQDFSGQTLGQFQDTDTYAGFPASHDMAADYMPAANSSHIYQVAPSGTVNALLAFEQDQSHLITPYSEYRSGIFSQYNLDQPAGFASGMMMPSPFLSDDFQQFNGDLVNSGEMFPSFEAPDNGI
ncbi:hypothetical protein AWENTII_006552 [Aspergillus wentii]